MIMRQTTLLLLAFFRLALGEGGLLRHSAKTASLSTSQARYRNESSFAGGALTKLQFRSGRLPTSRLAVHGWSTGKVAQELINSVLGLEMHAFVQSESLEMSSQIGISSEKIELPSVQVLSAKGLPTIEAWTIFAIPALASISYGLAGVGFAMVFHSLWYAAELLSIFSGSVAQANLLIFVFLPILNVTQVVHLLADVDARTLALWFFPYNAGFFPGMLIMFYLGEEPQMQGLLRILVAVLILCTVAFNVLKRFSNCLGSTDDNKTKDYWNDSKLFWGTAAYAFVDGILNGVVGMPGPLQVVWVLYMRVPKQLWRATGPANGLFINFWRLPYLIFSGYIDLTAPNFWRVVLFGGAGALVGLTIGNFLSRYTSQQRFEQILMFVLVPMGIGMLVSGGAQMTRSLA